MKNLNLIIVAVIMAIVLIGASWYFSGPDDSSGADKNASDVKISAGESVQDDDPYLGKQDAKVILVEFADFQCPSCALFHFGAGSAIFEEYVKKGLVKIVFKDFPFLGEESYSAAYAAGCAKEQGKFWEYHDYLFEYRMKNETENSGAFSVANLISFAEKIGLNRETFSDCLWSEKYKDKVAKDLEDGKNAGVIATPTIFINGRKEEGLLSFESYQKIIEEELKK